MPKLSMFAIFDGKYTNFEKSLEIQGFLRNFAH